MKTTRANLYIYPGGSQVADLQLQLLNDEPEVFFDGGVMRVVVENKGPVAATNVEVRVNSNANSTWVLSSNASQGTTDITNFSFLTEANWQVGSLASGAVATLDVELQRIDQYNTAFFFAQVQKSDQADPDSQPGSDTGPVYTPDEDDEGQLIMIGSGGPPADLELLKTADRSTALAGDQVTFTLLVENNGSYPSQNVTVKDILPPPV